MSYNWFGGCLCVCSDIYRAKVLLHAPAMCMEELNNGNKPKI